MDRSPLVAANRQLIEAVETPPETGLERRIDDLAAELWALERATDPDPGACCHLREKLRALERRTAPHRTGYVEQARRTLDVYGRSLDPV